MDNDWPWDQPRNCAVITENEIVEKGAPILHVSHDLHDHGWQFLGGDDARTENAILICLADIPELDPSVIEVAHMPPGWHAWRPSKEQPWTIEPNPEDQN